MKAAVGFDRIVLHLARLTVPREASFLMGFIRHKPLIAGTKVIALGSIYHLSNFLTL